jgi:hypothetical protein
VPDLLSSVISYFAHMSLLKKGILSFAVTVVLVELAFRRFGPKSAAYKRWTRFFEGIGKVWTAVILSVVYVLSVGPVSLVMRLMKRDPLDRKLDRDKTFWRAHEPNPLGPSAAVRHQF